MKMESPIQREEENYQQEVMEYNEQALFPVEEQSETLENGSYYTIDRDLSRKDRFQHQLAERLAINEAQQRKEMADKQHNNFKEEKIRKNGAVSKSELVAVEDEHKVREEERE